jgi:ATP-dependent Clp protease ATP-binding subunit ClpA
MGRRRGSDCDGRATRPLKRTIQRLVLDPLALKVLQGAFKEGEHIVVDAGGDRLTFRDDACEPVAAAQARVTVPTVGCR